MTQKSLVAQRGSPHGAAEIIAGVRLPRDALSALDSVEQARAGGRRDRWIKAFLAIRWVVETDGWLKLTPAGRSTRDEIMKECGD